MLLDQPFHATFVEYLELHEARTEDSVPGERGKLPRAEPLRDWCRKSLLSTIYNVFRDNAFRCLLQNVFRYTVANLNGRWNLQAEFDDSVIEKWHARFDRSSHR